MLKKELKEKALYSRLNKTFMDKYGDYEMSAGWYENPANNVWKFDIAEINKTVTLVCDKITGDVTIIEKNMEEE